MEHSPERTDQAQDIARQLQALSGVSTEVREAHGKTMLLCDYEPVRLPWEHEQASPAQERYLAFYAAFLRLQEERNMEAWNPSAMGWTDTIDVRMLIDRKTGMTAHVMPRSTGEIAVADGLPFRNDAIRTAVWRWVDKTDREKQTEHELWSGIALMGLHDQQIVAIAAGLKPSSFVLDCKPGTSLHAFAAASPHLRLGEAGTVSNAAAAKRVIRENADVFARLGWGEDEADEAIRVLTRCSETEGYPGSKEDMYRALGLLLGYDCQSCERYATFDSSAHWEKTFLPPDRPVPHQMSANPFNMYYVDYWIHDPQNNAHFHALKAAYDALPGRTAALMNAGMSPLETLHQLAADTPNLAEGIRGDFGDRMKSV